MKNLILTMLFTAFALSISSCKKDKNEKEANDKEVTLAKLQGKWDAVKFTEKNYEVASNKLVSETTQTYPANERAIEYKGSEILYYRNGSLKNTYTYTIRGNEIRIREGNNGFYFQLKFNSDTEHIHIEEYTYTSNKVVMKEVKETYYNKK